MSKTKSKDCKEICDGAIRQSVALNNSLNIASIGLLPEIICSISVYKKKYYYICVQKKPKHVGK